MKMLNKFAKTSTMATLLLAANAVWAVPMAVTWSISAMPAPVWAAPMTVTGNGISWTLYSAASGGDPNGSFTLKMDATNSTLGGSAILSAFSLKNWGGNVTAQNIDPNDWSVVNEGLNANGCQSNGTPSALCFFDTNLASAIHDTGIFEFNFDVSVSSGLPEFTHLKVHWQNASGKKIGSLISEDISWGCDAQHPCDPPVTVAEPGAIALLGIGLLGLGWARRRCHA